TATFMLPSTPPSAARWSVRGSGSPASVGHEGSLSFARAHIGTMLEEGARLGERLLARVGAGGGRGAMADRDSVDHAAAPAMLTRERRPVDVQAPAHAQVGEWQQRREGGARERGHGTDLDEARLAPNAVRPAAGAPPRGA